MFNHSKATVNSDIKTDGFEWKKAAEAVGKDGLICWGYILYNSQYGEGVALVANDHTLYRLPGRYVDVFKSATDEEREILMSGRKLSFDWYDSKKGKTVIAYIDDNAI